MSDAVPAGWVATVVQGVYQRKADGRRLQVWSTDWTTWLSLGRPGQVFMQRADRKPGPGGLAEAAAWADADYPPDPEDVSRWRESKRSRLLLQLEQAEERAKEAQQRVAEIRADLDALGGAE